MKKSTFLATAIFAGAFAQPAFAQDAEPRFFDGFYVGGSFGLDAIDDENGEGITFDTDGDGEYGDGVITTTGANAFSPGYCNGAANGAEASDGCSDDKSRYGYGIRIGFDQRIGNGPVVAGLLVEGALSESEDYSTGFSTTPASYTFVRGLDKSVAVRGRLGVSPGSGRGLLYVTGHDAKELYVLRLPRQGSTLEYVTTIDVPFEGQAWAWDRSEGRILYGIVRRTREVVVARIPEVPAAVLLR